VPAAWRENADLIAGIGYVKVGIDAPGLRRTVDFESDYLLAQRLAAPCRGRRISDEPALAHFCNSIPVRAVFPLPGLERKMTPCVSGHNSYGGSRLGFPRSVL